MPDDLAWPPGRHVGTKPAQLIMVLLGGRGSPALWYPRSCPLFQHTPTGAGLPAAHDEFVFRTITTLQLVCRQLGHGHVPLHQDQDQEQGLPWICPLMCLRPPWRIPLPCWLPGGALPHVGAWTDAALVSGLRVEGGGFRVEALGFRVWPGQASDGSALPWPDLSQPGGCTSEQGKTVRSEKIWGRQEEPGTPLGSCRGSCMPWASRTTGQRPAARGPCRQGSNRLVGETAGAGPGGGIVMIQGTSEGPCQEVGGPPWSEPAACCKARQPHAAPAALLRTHQAPNTCALAHLVCMHLDAPGPKP